MLFKVIIILINVGKQGFTKALFISINLMKKENINKKTIIAYETVSYYKRVHYCSLANENSDQF